MTARLLALETSSARLSIAVGTEARLLNRFQGPLEWRHAESLFGALERVMKKVRWTPESLTGVAVSIGPGSFTGIRIGLAAARTLGQTLGIPVLGISALDVLAAGQAVKTGWVAPTLDALRGDVFGALYQKEDGRLKQITAAARWTVEAWMTHVKRKIGTHSASLPGDAIQKYPALKKLGRAVPVADRYPKAETLLALARPALLRGGLPYKDVLPLYLREAAAVERRGHA